MYSELSFKNDFIIIISYEFLLIGVGSSVGRQYNYNVRVINTNNNNKAITLKNSDRYTRSDMV